MRIIDLNIDVLDSIVQLTLDEGSGDLAALIRTCRGFHELGMRHLLRDVYVYFSPSMVNFCHFILRRPDHAVFIRRLGWEHDGLTHKMVDDDDKRAASLFADVLPLCKNLTSLQLNATEVMLHLEPRLVDALAGCRRLVSAELAASWDPPEGRVAEALRRMQARLRALNLRSFKGPWPLDALHSFSRTLRSLTLCDMDFAPGLGGGVCLPLVEELKLDDCFLLTCDMIIAFPNVQALHVCGSSDDTKVYKLQLENNRIAKMSSAAHCWAQIPHVEGNFHGIWSLALSGGHVICLDITDCEIVAEDDIADVLQVLQNTRPVLVGIVVVASSLPDSFFARMAAAVPDLLALELQASFHSTSKVDTVIEYLERLSLALRPLRKLGHVGIDVQPYKETYHPWGHDFEQAFCLHDIDARTRVVRALLQRNASLGSVVVSWAIAGWDDHRFRVVESLSEDGRRTRWFRQSRHKFCMLPALQDAWEDDPEEARSIVAPKLVRARKGGKDVAAQLQASRWMC